MSFGVPLKVERKSSFWLHEKKKWMVVVISLHKKKKPSGSERWRKTWPSTDTMRFLRATESEVILRATKWLLSFCDLTVSAIQFQKTHTHKTGWWEPVKELRVNRWNGAAFRIQLCRVFLFVMMNRMFWRQQYVEPFVFIFKRRFGLYWRINRKREKNPTRTCKDKGPAAMTSFRTNRGKYCVWKRAVGVLYSKSEYD